MDDRTLSNEAVRRAAMRWLDLVDRGELQVAWSSASPQLRTGRKSASAFAAGTTEHEWCAEVGGMRSRLGPLRSRRLEAISRDDELGPGEQVASVALRFATMFDQIEGARETVVVREDPDAVWRVSAYRIVIGSRSHSG